MEWTNKKLNRVIELAGAGNSSGTIAKILTQEFRTHVTRSMVCGLCRRNKITLRSQQKAGGHGNGRSSI